MSWLKKLKAILMLVMMVSILIPSGVAQAAPAENYNLNGWDKTQAKWSPGNLSGYTELDWVPFRMVMSNYNGTATDICFQHDYEKIGVYGFSQSQNFYIGDTAGNQLYSLSDGVFSVTGPAYRTESGGVKIMEYCFDITNPQALINLDGDFCLYWETQLAGPQQASAWSGASLHTTTSVTGAQTVPISTQKIAPLLSPGVELQKTASTPVANPGDTISYTFTVTNIGDYSLTDVMITDPLFGASWSHSVGALAVGASTTYVATFTIPLDAEPGSLQNIATATGSYFGGTVSDTDDETIIIQITTATDAAINIHKNVNISEAQPGDDVLYSIHVTNTGDVDLENVVVTDPFFGASWSHSVGTLHVGQIVWIDVPYTVPLNTPSGVLVNTAAVSGTYSGGQVSGSASASLVIDADDDQDQYPGVELSKGVNTETANPGDTITYHFTVHNTGTYELTAVTVVDPLFGDSWSHMIAQLAPGASVTFTHDYQIPSDHASGIIENTASVSAIYSEGSVTDTASETVSVVKLPDSEEASLHVDKVSDVQTVVPGGSVTYTIFVTNNGGIDLDNVTATDHLMGDTWSYNFGSLHVGQTKEYTYTYTVPLGTQAGELTNTVSVLGSYDGGTTTGTDTVTVFIDAPPPQIANLILNSVCTDDPAQTRGWRITNTNHSDIPFTWTLLESNETGSGVALADSDFNLQTLTVTGVNTLKITYLETMEETKVSSGLVCPNDEMQLITIHSMCVASPSSDQVEWQINNPNNYTVVATWQVENLAGTISLAPGINILYTTVIPGTPNTLSLYIDGDLYAVESRACFRDIDLSAVCSNNPDLSLRWKLTNSNAYPAEVTWILLNSVPLQTGTIILQPGETYFYTNTIPGDNIVAIFVDDVLQRNGTVLSLKVACPPGETEDDTAILGEQDIDLGDTIEPSLPGGTIITEDILGDTDVLPQTGGIFAWYLYLPGSMLLLGGLLLLKNSRHLSRKQR